MGLRLEWGYNAGLPDDAVAAYGARLIIDQGGYVGQVWDRIDMTAVSDEAKPGSAKVLTIQHTCGADVGVYPSEEEALEALDYWVNRWFEYELPGVEKPADRAAAVDLYFGKVDREWYTITDAVFGQIRTQTEGPA